jgi:hypothetical protein
VTDGDVALLEMVKEQVEAVGATLEPDGEWAPAAHIETGGGDHVIAVAPGVPTEVVAIAWAEMCHQHDARRVAVVNMAWMVHQVDDEPPLDVPPFAHPDRREVVVISVVSPDGETTQMGRVGRSQTEPPLVYWIPEMEAMVFNRFTGAIQNRMGWDVH